MPTVHFVPTGFIFVETNNVEFTFSVMGKGKNIAEKLLYNEERLLQSDVRTSPEVLSALIADEFIEIGNSGRFYTKQDVIDILKNESAFEGTITNFQIMQLSSKIVLATCRMEETPKVGFQTRISVRSSLWKFTDGKWKIVFHQGTMLTEGENNHS
jgi:hypothetical protein